MPGFVIHLAAANVYLEKNPQEDPGEFIRGTIAPDCVPDKRVSHHSSPNYRRNGLTSLLEKVNLVECMPDFDIGTSFGRGYCFHLITDIEFYRFLANKDRTKFVNMKNTELDGLLYHDYFAITPFLKKKYNIIFPESIRDYDNGQTDRLFLIDRDETCKMIDRLGALDLREYLSNYGII